MLDIDWLDHATPSELRGRQKFETLSAGADRLTFERIEFEPDAPFL